LKWNERQLVIYTNELWVDPNYNRLGAATKQVCCFGRRTKLKFVKQYRTNALVWMILVYTYGVSMTRIFTLMKTKHTQWLQINNAQSQHSQRDFTCRAVACFVSLSQFTENVFSLITVNACTKNGHTLVGILKFFWSCWQECRVKLIIIRLLDGRYYILLVDAETKNDASPSDQIRICVKCNIKFFRLHYFYQLAPFSGWFLLTR
jgi:hypothetical protein